MPATAIVGANWGDEGKGKVADYLAAQAESDRAQVVLPYHILFDQYEEERLGARQFGSTKRGIAPFYADKYLKVGVQVADLYDEGRLRAQVEAALAGKNVLLEHLYGRPAA